MQHYKTAKEIKQLFKITNQTLNNWRRAGKIKYQQINERNFVYDLSSLNCYHEEQHPRINVIYARVSNTKQSQDLEKQKNLLADFANKNGYTVGVVLEEIASGMNENRVKFNQLIDMVLERKVNKIFISYKDRLTRFGFSYFDNLFKKFDTEIIVLNDESVNSFEQELTDDLISIIHHFSMKIYSNRRKLLRKIKKELETNTI